LLFEVLEFYRFLIPGFVGIWLVWISLKAGWLSADRKGWRIGELVGKLYLLLAILFQIMITPPLWYTQMSEAIDQSKPVAKATLQWQSGQIMSEMSYLELEADIKEFQLRFELSQESPDLAQISDLEQEIQLNKAVYQAVEDRLASFDDYTVEVSDWFKRVAEAQLEAEERLSSSQSWVWVLFVWGTIFVLWARFDEFNNELAEPIPIQSDHGRRNLLAVKGQAAIIKLKPKKSRHETQI